MRPDVVVVDAPSLDHAPGLGQRREHVLVQALVPQLAVEALHVAILHRLAWRDVVPGDRLLRRPLQHRVAGQLGAVVGDDHRRLTPFRNKTIEHAHDAPARQ